MIMSRSCNRTSRHACGCGNENKNMSRPVFIFGGAPAFSRTHKIPQKLTPNDKSPAHFRSFPISFFWLASRARKSAPNGP